jgi:7-cyano-7-deazaguanine synthase
MMANHSGDHTIYPDCRPEFVQAMSEAARTGTCFAGQGDDSGHPGVTLLCPFTGLTKGQIAARGRDLGIDYAETWSCYKGGERHCGRCGTCVERREALAEAGIADPTVYEAE